MAPVRGEMAAGRGSVSCEVRAAPEAEEEGRGDSETRPPRRLRLVIRTSVPRSRRIHPADHAGSTGSGIDPASDLVDRVGAEVVSAGLLDVAHRHPVPLEV